MEVVPETIRAGARQTSGTRVQYLGDVVDWLLGDAKAISRPKIKAGPLRPALFVHPIGCTSCPAWLVTTAPTARALLFYRVDQVIHVLANRPDCL
jgi:hypothetical protein